MYTENENIGWSRKWIGHKRYPSQPLWRNCSWWQELLLMTGMRISGFQRWPLRSAFTECARNGMPCSLSNKWQTERSDLLDKPGPHLDCAWGRCHLGRSRPGSEKVPSFGREGQGSELWGKKGGLLTATGTCTNLYSLPSSPHSPTLESAHRQLWLKV